MIIGIDASNIKSGGGLTHLLNLLNESNPKLHNFNLIVVWCNNNNYHKIPKRKWILKKKIFDGNINNFKMFIWQFFFLSKCAKKIGCNVVLFPGGIYFGNFRPFIAISQNMIPFEKSVLMEFFFKLKFIKFYLIKISQIHTFKKSQGIIFLTSYAKKKILKIINVKKINKIIEHGIDKNLKKIEFKKKNICNFKKNKKFKILYVSTIDRYKHQVNVMQAVNSLREKNKWDLELTFIGANYQDNQVDIFKEKMSFYNKKKNWIKYIPDLNHKKLIKMYTKFDLGVFASSCENLSNIILEKMSACLPLICSNTSSVSFWLKDYKNKFNPYNSKSLEKVLFKIIPSTFKRSLIAKNYKIKSNKFSWELTAKKTFNLINKYSDE